MLYYTNKNRYGYANNNTLFWTNMCVNCSDIYKNSFTLFADKTVTYGKPDHVPAG